MRRQPVGFVSALVLLAIVGVAAAAPVLSPYDPIQPIDGARLQSPSWDYWFGTDNASRDVLSRVIWGGRNSLLIGATAVALGLIGATTLGVLSGYFGGWVDNVIQRTTDAMMAIPGLLFVLFVVTILGTGRWPVLLAIAAGLIFPNSRIVRSATLGVRHSMYVEAARSIGAGSPRIILQHILPNIMAPIIIIATVSIGAAITIEASLSFLGLGVPPPDPTWGQMMGGRTRGFMLTAPWMALAPGLALTIVVFAFNMLGDSLRDVLDPRLRL